MSEARSLKRKRGKSTTEDDITSKVVGKLHHGVREVRKAAKKAKQFEIQKLVKRLKTLRADKSKVTEVPSLEAQLDVLKEIETEAIADTALRSKFKKDRLLSTQESVAGAVAAELSSKPVTEALAGSPLAKVQGRLLSSKLIAQDVATVIDSIRNILQPQMKTDFEREVDSEHGEDVPPQKNHKTKETFNSFSEDETEGEHEAVTDADADDSSSQELGDDDSWESGSIHSDPGAGTSSSESFSETDEAGADESRPLKLKPAATKKQRISDTRTHPGEPSTSSAHSTFLPSLAVGFTRGDSDASDLSEGEAEMVNGGPKKNRRGQRARRAIWEKKYGKNANHVKNDHQPTAKGSHKSGGRGDNSRNTRPQYPHPRERTVGTASADSRPHKAKAEPARKDEKPLHPSWEAKRRLKEKQTATILPSQSKKIVF